MPMAKHLLAEAASIAALRLLYFSVALSFLSIFLAHITIKKDGSTMDDFLISPHLRTSEYRNVHLTNHDNEGLSACLLVNDENPRLPEWIAYHYHVLPLRSLIVAVDPASRHQPTEILSRWPEMGVEIDTWHDTYYFGTEAGLCNSTDSHTCLMKHRRRQTTFMSRCMMDLKQRNKTWVLLIDVDEYISSDALDWDVASNFEVEKHAKKTTSKIGKQNTIRDVIRSQGTVDPCLPIARQLYGAKEGNSSHWRHMAPTGFDETDFVTLRYRWRALKNKVSVNRWQKTIIDVSRIPIEDLELKAHSVHLPLPKHCPKDPGKFRTTLLRANHYVDSFESYSYRKDPRAHEKQNFEFWMKKSKDAMKQMDMDLTPWLKAFVRSVGDKKAHVLLAGAGNFHVSRRV